MAVVGWGMQPSEFWGATMSELFWLLHFHHPEETGGKIGAMRRDEFDAAVERLKEIG